MTQRTILQNKALHKYFSVLADELNGAGYDMRKTLKPSVDIPWTPENIKEYLWRPIQDAVLSKVSTTELNTAEVDKIYAILSRHLGEKLGVFVDFPRETPPEPHSWEIYNGRDS